MSAIGVKRTLAGRSAVISVTDLWRDSQDAFRFLIEIKFRVPAQNLSCGASDRAPLATKGEFKMKRTEMLFMASVLALSIAGPVQAQGPTGGDYYAPGPTTVVHPTAGQLKLNEQGDYYVGDKMILNKRRAEALKKCTHNIAFESDRYVACMAKEGEAP